MVDRPLKSGALRFRQITQVDRRFVISGHTDGHIRRKGIVPVGRFLVLLAVENLDPPAFRRLDVRASQRN
jgi:hypothetical protein